MNGVEALKYCKGIILLSHLTPTFESDPFIIENNQFPLASTDTLLVNANLLALTFE